MGDKVIQALNDGNLTRARKAICEIPGRQMHAWRSGDELSLLHCVVSHCRETEHRREEFIDLVELLLGPCVFNANITSPSGIVPLHLAKNPSLVRVLVDKGAVVDEMTSEGFTPFMLRCMDGNHKTAEMLFECGASSSLLMPSGKYALDVLAVKCRDNFVKPILAASVSERRSYAW